MIVTTAHMLRADLAGFEAVYPKQGEEPECGLLPGKEGQAPVAGAQPALVHRQCKAAAAPAVHGMDFDLDAMTPPVWSNCQLEPGGHPAGPWHHLLGHIHTTTLCNRSHIVVQMVATESATPTCSRPADHPGWALAAGPRAAVIGACGTCGDRVRPSRAWPRAKRGLRRR